MMRAIILVVALAAGGVAAWLLLPMLSGGNPPPPARPQPPPLEVLVAAADLSQGHVVEARDLRWQVWPKEAMNPVLVSRSARPDALTSLVGSTVRGRFVAGEPILMEKFSRTPSGVLSARLPAGKRALAIRISAESAAGGFVLPNDRVDVIQSTAHQEGGRSEHRSRTLLSNIRVLAVDQLADDPKGLAVVAKTVTLELSAPQVQLVMAGEAAGSLSLALRSSADAEDRITSVPESGMVRIMRAGQSEIVRIQ